MYRGLNDINSILRRLAGGLGYSRIGKKSWVSYAKSLDWTVSRGSISLRGLEKQPKLILYDSAFLRAYLQTD